MPTLTPNFGLLQPLVNSSTDGDLWGGYLNTTIGDVDGLLLSALNMPITGKTASFSVTAPTAGSTTTGSANQLFTCNATSGTITGSLPSAVSAGNGFTVAFKKTDSSANTVTAAAAGSDTIDGAATFVLSAQYAWLILVSDGVSKWNVISDFASTVGLPTLAGSNAFTGTNSFSVSPTVPTATSGDSTTKAASTAFANPGASVASPGHVGLPSGWVFRMGTYAGGSSTSQSFDAPFATACLGVVLTPNSGNNVATAVVVGSPSTSGFNYALGNAADPGFYWAWGH